MSKARKVFAVAVLAALTCAVAQAQPPIRIGATLSGTGLAAALGPNQLRGYQLCVKYLNAKGGVRGRKLELVVYDERESPVVAAFNSMDGCSEPRRSSPP